MPPPLRVFFGVYARTRLHYRLGTQLLCGSGYSAQLNIIPIIRRAFHDGTVLGMPGQIGRAARPPLSDVLPFPSPLLSASDLARDAPSIRFLPTPPSFPSSVNDLQGNSSPVNYCRPTSGSRGVLPDPLHIATARTLCAETHIVLLQGVSSSTPLWHGICTMLGQSGQLTNPSNGAAQWRSQE